MISSGKPWFETWDAEIQQWRQCTVSRGAFEMLITIEKPDADTSVSYLGYQILTKYRIVAVDVGQVTITGPGIVSRCLSRRVWLIEKKLA